MDFARLIPAATIDTSAFVRLADSGLHPDRRADVQEAIGRDAISICLPVLLELGFAARTASDHDSVMDDLLGLRWAEIDDVVEARAVEVQRQLAHRGQHRPPPADLIVACLAERHRLGVLHYDRHFDVLLENSDLDYESVWLAAPGAL